MTDKYTTKILENNDIFIIFYSDWCGYCSKSIDLLKKNNMAFKGYKIDKIKGGIKTLLVNLTKSKAITGLNEDHKTRPIIFRNGKYIGGYHELLNEF